MSETNTAVIGSTDERESGRHPVNVGHLVMGIALLGLVAVWALIVGDVVEGDDVRWLLPAPWVLAGAAGLVAVAATGHRGRESRQVGWVTPTEATTEPADETEPVVETAPVDQTAPVDETAPIQQTTEPPTEETR